MNVILHTQNTSHDRGHATYCWKENMKRHTRTRAHTRSSTKNKETQTVKRGDTQSREEKNEQNTTNVLLTGFYIDKIAASLGWEKMRREGLKKEESVLNRTDGWMKAE